MEFCLHYNGPLKSKAGPKEKHKIRCQLHEQLKSICNNPPFLIAFEPDFNKTRKPTDVSLFKQIEDKKFWFLICEGLSTSVDLSLTLLVPHQTNAIVSGGDVDNRIKTLFDALRIPQLLNEIPSADNFDYSGGMFCLLEDDKLINSLQIKMYQDHNPIDERSCRVLIQVNTRITAAKWGSVNFI